MTVEHRVHYLQQFIRSENRYPDVKKNYTLFTSTCDCGWYTTQSRDPMVPIHAYSDHVNNPTSEDQRLVAQLVSENCRLKAKIASIKYWSQLEEDPY